MKAVINEKETPDGIYPCLKKLVYDTTGNTIIVLFEKPKCGTTVFKHVVEGNCLDEVGEYYQSWDESIFTPFTGSITLAND